MPAGERSASMAEDLPAKPVVDAYLGIGSRYSYLASTQLDRIAADAGVSFNWIPVNTADLFAGGRNPFAGPPISPQYEQRYREADARAWAEYYVVPFREPTGRLSFDPALLVRAVLAAGEARVPLMKRLFQAVFADDRTRIDIADVADFAQMVGLDRYKYRKALADPALEAERLVIAEQAKARGVFGVPYFIIGNRAFFGNDRLNLLHHYLVTMPVDGGSQHWT
jgi:2-hydroxychromene-2-carboxylate isomerase